MIKQLHYACALLLVAPAAWGSICGSVAGQNTLNFYTASGFSCTLDGLTFSNFSYIAPGGLPADSDVSIMPVDDGTNVGFVFSGMFASAASAAADALLSYTITAMPGETMTGDTVTLTKASATGSGSAAAVGEGICTGTMNSAGACTPASGAYSLLAIDNGGGGDMPSASVTFATPATMQTVSKDIVTQGGAGGSAMVSEFENTAQITGGGGSTGGGPTPEPGPLLTMGTGLVAFSLLIRKRVRNS